MARFYIPIGAVCSAGIYPFIQGLILDHIGHYWLVFSLLSYFLLVISCYTTWYISTVAVQMVTREGINWGLNPCHMENKESSLSPISIHNHTYVMVCLYVYSQNVMVEPWPNKFILQVQVSCFKHSLKSRDFLT